MGLLEKAARAAGVCILGQYGSGHDYDYEGVPHVDYDGTIDLQAVARAVLEAVREPDEDFPVDGDLRHFFTATIDHILSK